MTESENADLSVVQPDEAVGVVDPLADEVLDQRTLDAGHRAVLQCVEEQGRVVVHRGNGDLKIAKRDIIKLIYYLTWRLVLGVKRGSEDSRQFKKKKGGNLEIFRHVLITTLLRATCSTFFANMPEIV